MVERGLAETRSMAQRFIVAGQVRVSGQRVVKASSVFEPEVDIRIDRGPRFVSRGGEKLAAALAAFPIPVTDVVCADVGASTGGFTDVLLQNGAARVHAIDVGRGILHWKLRNDARVVVHEGTNVRHLPALPEPVGLIAIDVSFISLKLVLPVTRAWLGAAGGNIVALIKPQFEAGRAQASRGKGVIRDPTVHVEVQREILGFAVKTGLTVKGLMPSPLKGPKGNIEFLAWLQA